MIQLLLYNINVVEDAVPKDAMNNVFYVRE